MLCNCFWRPSVMLLGEPGGSPCYLMCPMRQGGRERCVASPADSCVARPRLCNSPAEMTRYGVATGAHPRRLEPSYAYAVITWGCRATPGQVWGDRRVLRHPERSRSHLTL